jgi:hypothetical protein
LSTYISPRLVVFFSFFQGKYVIADVTGFCTWIHPKRVFLLMQTRKRTVKYDTLNWTMARSALQSSRYVTRPTNRFWQKIKWKLYTRAKPVLWKLTSRVKNQLWYIIFSFDERYGIIDPLVRFTRALNSHFCCMFKSQKFYAWM